jgi:hypothetical protein
MGDAILQISCVTVRLQSGPGAEKRGVCDSRV